MAINDVSLTSGMRANLVSLQGTVDLLNRTQNRLSTGKKVNTALDDAVSFFTSQALTSRASDLSTLKDSMGEAVQTLNAANAGITSISSLINSAKAVAQSALGANKNQVKVTVGAIVNATVTIGGNVYGIITAGGTATATQIVASGDSATDASNLATLINSNAETTIDISASVSGNTITLTAKSASVAITQATQAFSTGSAAFTLQSDVNSNTVFSDRAALAASYNNIMTQIDAVANASGYKGVNLLGNNNLNVTFEGSSLTVKGFSATASDLKLSTLATTAGGASLQFPWTLNSDINTDLGKIDNAFTTLRAQSSQMSSNLSIINVQLDFSKNMIKTLTDGSDKLVLADMNEEGANMLMLQTRNSLGTTALTLSSQAAQSVLRLFG